MVSSKKYFDKRLSRSFMSLYMSKAIMMVGTGLLGMFIPIFLYELFDNNFQYVMFYFGGGYLLYALTLGFGVKVLNKIGFKSALRLSSLVGVLIYLILYFIDKSNVLYLIPATVIVGTIYRIFYWTPFRTDFTKFSRKGDFGKELSMFGATADIIGIFAPIAAGFIIVRFGFNALFVVAMLIYLMSAIPYSMLPKTYEKFTWSYGQTWKKLFSREWRRDLIAFFAEGAENVVGIAVWPIFIFDIFQGNYLKVGAMASMVVAVIVVLQLFVGKYIDKKKNQDRVLRYGSMFYALGWIFKIFIVTTFHVFVADVYHRLTQIFTKTPFLAMTYEIAADQGRYVDEYTVLRDIALNLGRVVMIMAVIIISAFFAVQWAFVFAAIAALLFNFLKKREVIESLH